MSERIEVRKAASWDAEVVGALVGRFFVEEGFDASRSEVAARAARFIREPGNAVFLARIGDTDVGVATVTTTFGFEVGRYAEIEDLYVTPESRRRGVATQLIAAATGWCREQRCRAVQVVVTPEAEQRHQLDAWYAQHGFEDTGRLIYERALD